MRWYRDRGDVIDFISYVVGYAPNEFPVEDHLMPDRQMNLDRAFDELRGGLARAAKELGGSIPLEPGQSMLDEAYTHYREGRTKQGAWKLQDLQQLLEKA